MFKRIITAIGATMLILGVASMDSEKLLIPVLITLIGGLIVLMSANTEEE